jgi:cytochrome c peroxidase
MSQAQKQFRTISSTRSLVAVAALTFWAGASSPTLAQGGPPPPGGPPIGGPLPAVQAPIGNQSTTNKVLLGKALFFDEQLSSTGQTSCATCHINGSGGSDPRAASSQSTNPGFDGLFGTNDDIVGSFGVIRSLANGRYDEHPDFGLERQVTGRKAPTMINAAFAPSLFWDGRATSTFSDPVTGGVVFLNNAALESQSVGPVVSDSEMGHVGRNWNEAVAKLENSKPLAAASGLGVVLGNYVAGRTYGDLYDEAFGPGGVTASRTAMAIATYERSLISNQAPFSQGPGGLTPQENDGRQLFVTKARCNICHNGPLLTDFLFKNTGVTPLFQDLGQGAITGNPQENGRFKTPDLMNIELRAPYFHNGSAKTLEEVVDFYDRGGDFHINQAAAIIPLGLTAQEKAALVAFLKRPLTDTRVASEVGPFNRPLLYSESNDTAIHYGFGTAAPSGITPRAIAIEPQYIGNSSVTVAVADAPPFGNAVLAMDFSQGFFNVLGASVLLGGTANMQLFPVGPMQGSGAGGGYASTSLSIPNLGSLIGLPVYLQWFILGGQLSASEGVEVVLF